MGPGVAYWTAGECANQNSSPIFKGSYSIPHLVLPPQCHPERPPYFANNSRFLTAELKRYLDCCVLWSYVVCCIGYMGRNPYGRRGWVWYYSPRDADSIVFHELRVIPPLRLSGIGRGSILNSWPNCIPANWPIFAQIDVEALIGFLVDPIAGQWLSLRPVPPIVQIRAAAPPGAMRKPF